MKSWSVAIEMPATGQYFSVRLFIMMYKMVLTFEFVDKILKREHSIKATELSTFLWFRSWQNLITTLSNLYAV